MSAPPSLDSNLGTVTTTPDQQHRAALYVAGKSESLDDARLLLAMLGLDGAA